MAISHEARKTLEAILVQHYDGDLLTTPALNDIIAVFDAETNAGQGEREPETFIENVEHDENDLRIQVSKQLLAGMLASFREFQQVEELPEADTIGRAKERVKIALLHADCLIEMVGAK